MDNKETIKKPLFDQAWNSSEEDESQRNLPIAKSYVQGKFRDAYGKTSRKISEEENSIRKMVLELKINYEDFKTDDGASALHRIKLLKNQQEALKQYYKLLFGEELDTKGLELPSLLG